MESLDTEHLEHAAASGDRRVHTIGTDRTPPGGCFDRRTFSCARDAPAALFSAVKARPETK
jgi:hypothetical protein